MTENSKGCHMPDTRSIQIVNGLGERLAPTIREHLMGIIFGIDIKCRNKDELQAYYDAMAYYNENSLDRLKLSVEALMGPNTHDTPKKSRKKSPPRPA